MKEPKVITVNCLDLILSGQWSPDDCCPACHTEQIERTRGTKYNIPTDFNIRLCCAALALVMDEKHPLDWEAIRRAAISRRLMERGEA